VDGVSRLLHTQNCKCFSLVIPVQHGIDCYCSFILVVEQINVMMIMITIMQEINTNGLLDGQLLVGGLGPFSLSTIKSSHDERPQ